jgi:pilus assembly protein CpaC
MSRTLIRRLGINGLLLHPRVWHVRVEPADNDARREQLRSNHRYPCPLLELDTKCHPSSQWRVRLRQGNITWSGFIDALQEQKLAGIGQTDLGGPEDKPLPRGNFHPSPRRLASSRFSQNWGRVDFTPNVLSDKHISINVAPEVSELDFRTPPTSGLSIPAISTRRASTVIELADGQSFAIGGLLQDKVRSDIKQFLSDIPILGASSVVPLPKKRDRVGHYRDAASGQTPESGWPAASDRLFRGTE